MKVSAAGKQMRGKECADETGEQARAGCLILSFIQQINIEHFLCLALDTGDLAVEYIIVGK